VNSPPLPGEPNHPAQALQPQIRPHQDLTLLFPIRRLHQQIEDINGGVDQALAEDKTLVLGETIHALQKPLGHVVPPHQKYGRFVAPSRRGCCGITHRLKNGPDAGAGWRPPAPAFISPLPRRQPLEGKRVQGERAPRPARRRQIATPRLISPAIAAYVLGSGMGARLATRKP